VFDTVGGGGWVMGREAAASARPKPMAGDELRTIGVMGPMFRRIFKELPQAAQPPGSAVEN